jgi:hypothetical protein
MGLSGTQHLMKAAGIDPLNPVGSLLEKMNIDPTQVMQVFEGLKNLASQVSERQGRIEAKLDLILAGQAREEMRRLNDGRREDVDEVLDRLREANILPIPEDEATFKLQGVIYGDSGK